MKKYLVAIFIGVMMFGISAKAMAAAAASDVVCNGCVGTTDIAGVAVTEAKLGTSAVTNTKIADGAVTDAKITGPIAASKIEKPANVITVAQSGGDFTSIGEALDSLPTPNTTPVLIKVMPGTYDEGSYSRYTEVKDNVTLQGAGRDVTTIEGCLWVNRGTNITISGFSIRPATVNPTNFSIWVANNVNLPDQKITIEGNYLSGGTFGGLVLDGCSPYITASDNILAGNTNGLTLDGCSGATVRNNTIIENSSSGITYSGAISEAQIVGNVISNNGLHGINTGNNSKLQIRNNDISNNGGSGIYLSNSTPKVTGNTIVNNTTDVTIAGGSANISHNVFDTVSGTLTGSFNVKSDGTAW